MSTEGLRLGQLVSSRAGRDADRYFALLEVLDDRFVAIADGDRRKVEKPKKKNIRHLIIHRAVLPEIEQKLLIGEYPTNAEVKRALETFVRGLAGEESAGRRGGER